MLPGTSSSDQKHNEDDWDLARRGICLILLNKNEEATALFENREESTELAVGHAYIRFMNAVMSCEENNCIEASTILKDLETKCAQNLGWLRAVKNKVFGRAELSLYESLEQQIALADCQVLLASLSLMTQDNTANWVKGGWALRKAWGLYHSTYNYLAAEYKKVLGDDIDLLGTDSSPWRILIRESGASTPVSPTGEWSIPSTPMTETPTGNGYRRSWTKMFSSAQTPQLSGDEIKRLMTATCFGYGLFHLCVSMLPTTILRLIQILGFAGDRAIGLNALMFARHGVDMRGPLALLVLLWYHTIMQPLIAVDPETITASTTAADELLKETKEEFNKSALFIFFYGRVCRLKNKIKDAIRAYTKAKEKSGQRELGLLCLHEMAWCHLIQLNYTRAYRAFATLRAQSHWSRAFYTYLAGVCGGCLGNDACLGVLVPPLLKLSGSHATLEGMIAQRSKLLLPFKSLFHYRLLAYEMVYLWSSLPAREGLLAIIEDCESSEINVEPMKGLVSFILGVCFLRLKEWDKAIEHLKNVLSIRAGCPAKSPYTHLTACALYELALALIKSSDENINEGIALLEKAQNYTGYDFESRLTLRISAALRQYKYNDL